MEDKEIEHVQDGLQNIRESGLNDLELDDEHYLTCDCEYCHCYLTNEYTEFTTEFKLCIDKHYITCKLGCCICLDHNCDTHSCEMYYQKENEFIRKIGD